MANAKYKDWILETIDSLRKRKARPDIERICHMVKRKHGVAAAETEAELERLVDSEIVIKVDYKGSTSYRNAAKWRKSHLSGNVLNSAEATRILKNAVKKLTEEDGRNSGIGIREIEKFLTAQDHGTKFVKSHLQVALQREVGASRLLRLKNGNYSLSKESESPKKAGRPAKRKRIKKTHGPEFEQEPISKPNSKEAEEDDAMDTKCDYCLLTAECNRAGDTEDLLICKDCNAKAHPSCMNYSAKLAIRARMSPWQCFDCKTCFVCGDAGDADSLLFCDSCDKGYHMACHKPPVIKKPTGKWMCDTCVKEDPSNLNSDSATPATVTSESESECVEDNQKDKETVTADISVLPTPAETPEPVEATGPEPMEVDEKDATDGKSKDVAVKEEEKMEEEAQEEAEEEVEEEDKKDDPKKSASPKSDSSSPDVATPTAQTANLPEQSAKSGVPSDPANWTIKDVSNYFRNQGFPQQAHVFEEQEIDGKSLLLLKRSDVLTGLSLKLGPALKIYNFVKKLQTLNQPPSIYT